MRYNKNVLLLSFGDFEFDGRLRELRKVFSEIGVVECYSRNSGQAPKGCITYKGGYLKYIRSAIRHACKLGEVDCLVLDNRKSTIPGLFIKALLKPRLTIQDCRELYLPEETKNLISRAGCFFEVFSAKRADIIICAGTERAELMRKRWKLKRTPIVFENLRKLGYESEAARLDAVARIKPHLISGEYRIVSTAGCDTSRMTDVLVRGIAQIEHPVKLYLVGDSSPNDIKAIQGIVKDLGLEERVSILGRLNQNELKYLLESCHIGIVSYHQLDTNNRLCASGKAYEYLYEGLPIVTTTNPPLRKLCSNYGVGVSDDSFSDGINQIIEEMEEFRNRVSCFVERNSVDENNRRLVVELEKIIDQVGI